MAEHSLPEPTTTAPADDIHLTTYSRFKTGFTKLDVELTGKYAGLANNKGVLVYDLEEQDKRHNFSLFQGQGLVGAIKWNPHYNRRMHIASALGQEVIIWDMGVKAPHSVETRHRDTSEVVDICWSPFEENTIVSAGFSYSMLLWDTRAQKPVREFNVGTDTTQVSFNRKNTHILASASGGQVWVWDTRKAKKPLVKINATDRGTAVTSLDWSYENQYDLLTSGGGDLNVKLWSVATAIPEQRTSYINIAADQRTLQQPVKRVLFVPVAQAAITTSRGELEARHELQTIKMWSLDPVRRFQQVNTLTAGSQRIIGVCFRMLGVEGLQYQVASLDAANHLRLHDIEGPKQSGTGVDLPAGSSSAWRESASTAGSESLEGATTSTASVLKDDLIPPVWSKLANAASSTMAAETMRITGGNAMREIMEVERAARLGAFDPVSDVRLYPTQKCVTLVMVASAEASASRLSSAQGAPQQRQSAREPGIPDAPNVLRASRKFVADARLRVTAKAPPEYRFRDEPPVVRLEATGGSVSVKNRDGAARDAATTFGGGVLDSITHTMLQQRSLPSAHLTTSNPKHTTNVAHDRTKWSKGPLDEDTLKRLQILADDAMRQAPKSRQSRLEACLLRLRRKLNERVRNVVQQAEDLATRKEDLSLPLDHQSGLQFVLDETRVVPVTSEPTAGAKASDPSPRTELPTLASGLSAVSGLSSLSAVSAVSEPIVPCPRRFGATFAPGGTLVVFSSSLAVIRARTDDARKHRARGGSQGSAASAYPRTFASFLHCLKKIRTFDIADETHDDELQQYLQHQHGPGADESRTWLRPWGPAPAPPPDNMDDNTRDDNDLDDTININPNVNVNAWEDQEGDPYDMEAYSTESDHSSGVEESETLIPYNYGDSTRLPISHPDHSLGPGLGPSSDTDIGTDNDSVDKDGDCDHGRTGGDNDTDVIIKGQVPWTPKPKQVMLVDCSRFLPGSRELAASYKLGGRSDPWRARAHRQCGANLANQTNQTVSAFGYGQNAHDAHKDMLGRISVVMDLRTDLDPPALSRGGSHGHVHRHGSHGARRGLSDMPPPLSSAKKTHHAAATTQDTTAGGGGNVKQGNALWAGPDRPPFLVGSLGRSSKARKGGLLPRVYSPNEMIFGGLGSHHQGQSAWEYWDAAKLTLGEQGFNIRRPRPRMSIMTSMLKEASSVTTLSRGTAGHCETGTQNRAAQRLPNCLASSSVGSRRSSGILSDFGTDLAHGAKAIPARAHQSQADRNAIVSAGSANSAGIAEEPTVEQVARIDVDQGLKDHSLLQSNTTTSESTTTTDVGNAEEYCANLCRYNAAVATGCGYPEQATWHAGWRGTASRSIEKVLRHFEIMGDPQTLASMVCVLASASKGGGYGTLLPRGEDNMSKYDRYLTSYAEQLYQWSANGVRTEIISHVRGGGNQPSFNATSTMASVCDQGIEEGQLRCSLCGKLVGLAAPTCALCGHGGHSLHMKSWFADESECPEDGCKCQCWMEVEGAWDGVMWQLDYVTHGKM